MIVHGCAVYRTRSAAHPRCLPWMLATKMFEPHIRGSLTGRVEGRSVTLSIGIDIRDGRAALFNGGFGLLHLVSFLGDSYKITAIEPGIFSSHIILTVEDKSIRFKTSKRICDALRLIYLKE